MGKIIVRETKNRTFVRVGLWSLIVSSWASGLTYLWFGEVSRAITLNIIIIVIAFISKIYYERRWLHIKWGISNEKEFENEQK